MIRAPVAWAVLGGVAVLAWVAYSSNAPARPARDGARQAPAPRVVASLPLPGPGIHVVAIPNELMESTRCIVAVTDAGNVATSCAPKELDLSTPDE